jgi:hypothetical protein
MERGIYFFCRRWRRLPVAGCRKTRHAYYHRKANWKDKISQIGKIAQIDKRDKTKTTQKAT